ncbi:hypothetical protein Y1Q_0004636 [Alligator mississippiensis]|nr:hypothetical protein Y1Q_0004636 [Alligator mississippiensis]
MDFRRKVENNDFPFPDYINVGMEMMVSGQVCSKEQPSEGVDCYTDTAKSKKIVRMINYEEEEGELAKMVTVNTNGENASNIHIAAGKTP